MWAILETFASRHQLWITCTISWWSWAAVRLGFMNLWTVTCLSTTFWCTVVNGHTITLMFCIKLVYDWPHLQGYCAQAFVAEYVPYFFPKGFLGFSYRAAARQSLPIYYCVIYACQALAWLVNVDLLDEHIHYGSIHHYFYNAAAHGPIDGVKNIAILLGSNWWFYHIQVPINDLV